MSLSRFAALSCLLFGSALSKPTPQSSATTTSAQAFPTACGDIIRQADVDDVFVFGATEVYQCLASVPFNDAVALRFLDYYNTTLQFQSTLAYLKNPPEGYQQPAVDLIDGLSVIKQNVTAGYYKNQYAFEAEVQKLVYSAHDMHLDLTAGVLSAFSYGSPYEVVSVSRDGKEPPQVYLTGDIVNSEDPTTAIPIKTINGEDPVEFLIKFAALNSQGTLEPHADWNQLMSSPVLDIQNYYTVFTGGATFYPGDELLFEWSDGDYINTEWISFYDNPSHTGPLSTGGDFYNYFVLGLLPGAYNESDYPSGSEDDGDYVSDNVTDWNYDSFEAFPKNPAVVQEGLSTNGDGIVTGYFLENNKTGVLSIPTFDMYGDYISGFSQAVIDFIDYAQLHNTTRIVIDLQQNLGGSPMLAYDTYQRFFPGPGTYRGSRRRSHAMADALGNATTQFWEALEPGTDDYEYWYEYLAADEWVITDRINADTGKNFTSWAEYSGPRTYNGDNFSLTERYNLSSPVFEWGAFDGYELPEEYPPQPWPAKDIVILTDGLCSSSCAQFVEWMTQRGVRTVVAGGAPTPGPMQAASGNRGARLYSADLLDSDIDWVRSIDNTTLATLPANRDPGITMIAYAGLNLRDQVRANDSTPLQFQYLAAHCRIYYTLTNIYNMTRLWLDAAHATWDDPSLCVANSTGYATIANTTTAKDPPPPSSTADVAVNALTSTLDINADPNDTINNAPPTTALEASIGYASSNITVCATKGSKCKLGYKAVTNADIDCPTGYAKASCICMPLCSGGQHGSSCPRDLTCKNRTSKVQDKSASAPAGARLANYQKGQSGASTGTCRENGRKLVGYGKSLCVKKK